MGSSLGGYKEGWLAPYFFFLQERILLNSLNLTRNCNRIGDVKLVKTKRRAVFTELATENPSRLTDF